MMTENFDYVVIMIKLATDSYLSDRDYTRGFSPTVPESDTSRHAPISCQWEKKKLVPNQNQTRKSLI